MRGSLERTPSAEGVSMAAGMVVFANKAGSCTGRYLFIILRGWARRSTSLAPWATNCTQKQDYTPHTQVHTHQYRVLSHAPKYRERSAE